MEPVAALRREELRREADAQRQASVVRTADRARRRAARLSASRTN